jgi:hypothetical protein
MKKHDSAYYPYIRLLQPRKLFSTLFVLIFIDSFLYGFHVNAQVSNGVFFKVGNGYTDGVPRQIVRTNTDRLYIFSPNAQHTSIINVFWTGTPGLPTNTASFNGSTSTIVNPAQPELPLSVDAVYDGNNIIHVLVNTRQGTLRDHPFDITTNTFRTPILISGNTPSFSGNYIGTVGVSGMFTPNGNLHVAYWSNGEHITHQIYNYNTGTNALTPVGSATQVDQTGHANHPAIAVSPLDNSITISWISETGTKQILARTRSSNGVWTAIQTVSTSVPWTSRNEGVNIDQGPNMLITPDGTRHLLYIENWDNTNYYGKVHYAVNAHNSTTWSDTALNLYSHNPGLATNAVGDLYLIGHGAVSTSENVNMYVLKKNSNGTWGAPQLFAAPPTGENFDASPSIKWSVVGFNRPEMVEFVFFTPISGNYNNTSIYYGRFPIGGGGTPPTNTPTNTPTKTPTNTPTNTPTQTQTSPVTPTSATNAKPIVPFVRDNTPTLTWSAISWAVGYQVELDDQPGFTLPTVANVSAATQSYTTATLSNKTYYWRVRAKKNDLEWGNWSATQSFVVSAP